MLGFDRGDWLSFDPFCKLVYGDKQVGEAPGRLFEWPNQVEPPDRKGPRDGDHLECLGWEVCLPSIVLTPFVGAYDLLGVDYCCEPVEALSECVFNQGPRRGMVTVDPAMDVAQQKFSLFARDTKLEDPGVAPFVEFALYKNEGLGATCELSSFCLVYRQCVAEEVVEVKHSPVIGTVRLCCWVLFKLHDLGVGRSSWWVSP